MDIKTYQELIKKTLSSLDTPLSDQIHMVLGIVTEAGELADIYKKTLAYGKPFDEVAVVEELGDLFWYILNLVSLLKLDLGKILDLNIEKLKSRYPDWQFDPERAIHRNTVYEREVLENGYRN